MRAIALLMMFTCGAAQAADRNVILFVADGLRGGIVDEIDAPTMSDIRAKGVNFSNSFSVFPTFTMVNASAFASGHLVGDTGIFGNTMLTPQPLSLDPRGKSVTPFFEFNPALRDVNELYHDHGGLMSEETVISAARRAGIQTAAVGKLGPVAMQSLEDFDSGKTIVIDDSIGHNEPMEDGNARHITLPVDIESAIEQVTGRPARAPTRRQPGGSCETPGTMAANLLQQDWFAKVTTDVLLPRFKAANKPFFLVFWSRDPDGTQHNHGDSTGYLVPGINGPTVRAGVRNADDALRKIRDTVRALGLESTTDIIISADHGFSTVSKESKTSGSAILKCGELTNALPQGFVAMDIARELDLPAVDPDAGNSPIRPVVGSFSKRGHALIGNNPDKPEVVVTANGGSDLLYLPSPARKKLAPRIVKFLLTQDYVSGIFVADDLGKIPGTLPLSAINLVGDSHTIRPSMVLNFKSFSTGCAIPTNCGVEIADSGTLQGQGMHGSFSRADTFNFMAAIGPSFKAGHVNKAPASNADVSMTIAKILGLNMKHPGKLTGRVLTEALVGGADVPFTRKVIAGPPAGDLATTMIVQEAQGVRYLEAGGFPGRTLGLDLPLR